MCIYATKAGLLNRAASQRTDAMQTPNPINATVPTQSNPFYDSQKDVAFMPEELPNISQPSGSISRIAMENLKSIMPFTKTPVRDMLMNKRAITKMQAIVIAVIIVVVAIAGAYYVLTLPPAEPEPEEITLNLLGWSYPDLYVKQFIAEYEEDHPNVKINWETGPSQEYYEKAVTLLTTSPEEVDILFVDWGYAKSFKDAGWIYALEDVDFIETTELNQIKNELTADAKALFTIDNKLYGLPYFMGAYTYFYNKAVLADHGFDTAPETWDELFDMSEAMQDAGTFETPILWALETAPYGAHLAWENLAASIGGEDTRLFGPAPDYEPLFTDPEHAGYKALELLQRSYTEGLAALSSIENSQLICQSTAQNGEVTPWVMLISPHNMDDMNNPAVSATAGEWEFMLPPDTGWCIVRGAFFALSTHLMENKPLSHQEAAWHFMKDYIGSPRWGKEFAIADGLGFGWKELWDDPTIKKAWDRHVDFEAVKAQSDRAIPVTTLATVYDAEWFPEWRLAINAYIQDCFIGDLTPAEAADAMADFTDNLH